jgi:5-methylcytosine-specific restriction enzyme A
MPTEEKARYFEGATRQVLVNAYERNAHARQACLDHYGHACQICDFDFAAFYGPMGEGYIHVHHVNDLSLIGEEYEVDPVTDLRPVCPNCHSMLHKTCPAMAIEDLRGILKAVNRKP